MIDLRYVKKLIDILDESTVDSIEISSDKGMKIRISKVRRGGAMQVAPQPMMAPAALPGPARPAEGMAAMDWRNGASQGGDRGESPMVGTFYGAPSRARAFGSAGTRV